MSDDCFAEDTEVPYRGAAPPQAYEVIGKAKPHFIEIESDDSFLNLPDPVYADLKDAPDNGVKEDQTQ